MSKFLPSYHKLGPAAIQVEFRPRPCKVGLMRMYRQVQGQRRIGRGEVNEITRRATISRDMPWVASEWEEGCALR